MLIYELSWYLSDQEKISSNARIPADLVPRFHELIDRVVARLDPEVVTRHKVRFRICYRSRHDDRHPLCP